MTIEELNSLFSCMKEKGFDIDRSDDMFHPIVYTRGALSFCISDNYVMAFTSVGTIVQARKDDCSFDSEKSILTVGNRKFIL